MHRHTISWIALCVSFGLPGQAWAGTASGSKVDCNWGPDCNDNNICTDDYCNTCSGSTCKKKRWCSNSLTWIGDSNNCTDDACIPGVGITHTPRPCPAIDQCHLKGSCYFADYYGMAPTCSEPIAPDGTPCNDGNGCTQNDACQNGVCVGANPTTIGIDFETRPYVVAPVCSAGVFPTNGSLGVAGPSSALNFGPTDSFSVAFWASLELQPQHIVVKGDNTSMEWSIVSSPSGLCFRRQNVADIACAPPVPAGFHHYVATYQAGAVSLYQDGVVTATGNGLIGDAAMTPLNIGNYSVNSNNLVGQLDDFAMFNRVLSAAEVQSLNARTTSPAALGNVAGQWSFDEGTGTTVADGSGNGNTLNLIGSGWSPTCANPRPTSAVQAASIFNAQPANVAGYGQANVTSLESFSNQTVLGGVNNNILYKVKFGVSVGPAQVGKWGFRLGADFAYGGAIVVDGVEVVSRWSDLPGIWWNGSFTNPTQSMTAYVDLSQGLHTVEIYGVENCCDGTGTLQFTAPGISSLWTPLEKSSLSTCG